MAEYIKVRPSECGEYLIIITDREGFDKFERLISRAKPLRTDSPVNFKEWHDRVKGSFLAGAAVMGWKR